MGTGSSSTLGIFLAGVAQEFGLGKSTISDLQRDGKNIEKFSAGSADPSGLKKRCMVRRDNDKDYIMSWILVYSEKKKKEKKGICIGPLVMDKVEILYAYE